MPFSKIIQELKWKFIQNKIDKIKLAVFDVDGVFTDGYLNYDSNGQQSKRFSVKDGIGIRFLQKANIEIAIITGGKSDVIEKRARDLNINYLFTNIKNKNDCIMRLQENLSFSVEETIFLGDDINDLTVRNRVNLLISTNDASKDLKKRSDAILLSNGGKGAVREFSERILKKNKKFKKIKEEGLLESN